MLALRARTAVRGTPKMPCEQTRTSALKALIAKASITRTWPWSRCCKNYYRYKHATWYVETGWDDERPDVLLFLKFKKFNDFFVRQRKKSPNIFDKICQRYGKIRSLNCGENLSSDHTMTISKWVWGLILPLVRSNDR